MASAKLARTTKELAAPTRVRLSGDFHDYRGQIEFATNSIAADAPVKSDVQSGSASDAPAKPAEPIEEAVVGKAPEDGGDTLTGVIRDIRNIPTQTGLKMVVFRVGKYSCKAFGKTAEGLYKKSSEYTGQRVAMYGEWETNQRGVKEFKTTARYVPTNARPAEPACSTKRQAPEADSLPIPSPQHEPAIARTSATEQSANTVQETSNDAVALAVKVEELTEQMRTISPAIATARLDASVEEAVTGKAPEVQGVISKIKNLPTRDGRKMVIFKIGPHNCRLFGKAAEFIDTNALEYEGKLIAVYGDWKTNQRGRKEFILAESTSTTQQPDCAVAVTADEVQKAVEDALLDASGLRSAAGPTFEEMEAEYRARKEHKRSEQQAESSAVAA